MLVRIVTIYGLADPRDHIVRYVGKAVDPKERLARHLEPRQLAQKNHRANWLKKLLAEGVRPELIELERCPKTEWQERERYWIAYYREQGHDLVNGTDGGDGVHNPAAWLREALGKAWRGKKMPPEIGEKISRSLKGKPKTPEHNAKVAERARGRRPSEATRLIMSERKRGLKLRARYYLVTWPDGRQDPVFGLADYCKANGLGHNKMSELLHGKLRYYRGMQVVEITEEEYHRLRGDAEDAEG